MALPVALAAATLLAVTATRRGAACHGGFPHPATRCCIHAAAGEEEKG